MLDEFVIRPATPADARLLAAHRVAMFEEMAGHPRPVGDSLLSESAAFFTETLQSGEYRGWLACPAGSLHVVAAGAGVQLRRILPRPQAEGPGVALGQEGLIGNVYTVQAWRRKGLARLLVTQIIAWAPTAGLARLVLHASAEGRALYESLGFVATNEMRYQ